MTSQCSVLAYRESKDYSVNALGSPKLTNCLQILSGAHSVLLKVKSMQESLLSSIAADENFLRNEPTNSMERYGSPRNAT